MRTKTLVATALSVLAVLGLGACGSSSKDATSNTTSTSEAESPIGDKPENETFCQQFVQQMQSVATASQQGNLEQISATFTELSTDAPTEIQPQFETIATALDTSANGGQQSATASSDVQAAIVNITTYVSKNCPNIDMTALAGLGGDAASMTTTTMAMAH